VIGGDTSRRPGRTRRFLRLVLETTRTNGAYVDTDLRHEWVHNPASEPPEEEILGRTDEELFSAEMAAPTTRIKREAIETGSRVEREFTSVRPWGQSRYRAAAEPLYDAAGDVEGAMFAATDVSDRYRVLERTTDAVFTVDTDWRVTFWNDRMARQTGIDPETVVGRELWDIFEKAFPAHLEERYREVMATGEPVEFEQRLPDPFDGWVEIRVFADEDGLSVFSRDISTRKEYQERLRDQRDTLDVLNRMLSHDIRNDIQLVTACAETVLGRLDGEDREHVETIADAAEHAVELTRSASDVSDTVFTDEDSPGDVSLRPVLRTEIDTVQESYPGADLSVEGSLPDVAVPADRMLGSVFRNLLKNAVIHSDRAAPTVRVAATTHPDGVEVRVADDGPGIPDGRKERVFGSGEAGLESDGTGIGLYLVDTLVERYGGEVRVSDNEPRGASFAVWLPTVTDPDDR
jgi:PAS domain S-box-containing protein